MTWLDYQIEDLSGSPEVDKKVFGPLEEIDDNMVNEDRMILMREKMNMWVLGNIGSFNNQRSLMMFICSGHRHE